MEVNNMDDKMTNSDEIKKCIREVMAKDKAKIPPQAASLIEETLTRIELENLSLKDALGFSQDLIEEIYEHGYHLFQSGKYKEALPIFELLRQLDGMDPRYTFAMAASHHQIKNYSEAAGYYMLCEVLDSKNPLPYYHLYDCFTRINEPSLAAGALNAADRLAGENPQYADLKNKIEMELKHLASIK
jgi:type III secretion system low calcium response chaperone LcrH/SycD